MKKGLKIGTILLLILILFVLITVYHQDNDKIHNIQINNEIWIEEEKIYASDGESDDLFGYSVSIDGDYAIIGAPADDDKGGMSGSVYIFKRENTTWNEKSKLLASDGTEEDHFGGSISINSNYIIIGAPGDDDNGDDSGSAYIFRREGTSWIEDTKLLASDGEKDDLFGMTVSIDGDYAIIGAPYDNQNGNRSGSAYIFKRQGIDWIEQKKLLPVDGKEDDLFGGSVSIDDDYAIIGAPGDNDKGIRSGSAYIFKRNDLDWIEHSKILASDGIASDNFGSSVSIDGDYVIIGSSGSYDNESRPSNVYIFKRKSTTWIEQSKLKTSDKIEDFHSSWTISVSINNDYAIIGKTYRNENRSKSGSAYIFKRNGTDWNQLYQLTPLIVLEDDNFGITVSIEGDYAIVGASYSDEKGKYAGCAYIFRKNFKIV